MLSSSQRLEFLSDEREEIVTPQGQESSHSLVTTSPRGPTS